MDELEKEFLKLLTVHSVDYALEKANDGNGYFKNLIIVAKAAAALYIEKQKQNLELIKELWGLWESMAECGELHIGKNFSEKHDALKKQIFGTSSLKYKIKINRTEFEVNQFISGKLIKRLSGVTADMELRSRPLMVNNKPNWRSFLFVRGIEPDKEIGDNEIIDVANPETRVFIVANVRTTE